MATKDSGGKKPSKPVIGTPNRLNNVTSDANAQQVQVLFTHEYAGKGTVTYTATSSPGAKFATAASSPVTVTGLTSGTSYTFTVVANTNYGVSADVSDASSAVTPPSFPPNFCPPCVTAGPSGPPCTYIGYTCDGTLSYEYYDCGGCQTCPGTGGYNGAYRDGVCGYTAPPSFGPDFPPPFGPTFGPDFPPAFK
jgi:hypothetical protein